MQIDVDIVEDSGLQRSYDGVTYTETASRVAKVSGLTTDGSAQDASTAMSRAVNAVQAAYPLGQIYPGSHCAINGYAGAGEYSDGVKVRINYAIPSKSTASGVFTVSESTTTESDRTNFYRDDAEGIVTQLVVKYQDPKTKQVLKDSTATIEYETTIRRVVLQTTTTNQKDVIALRKTANCVNDAPWNGLPRAFWRVTEFNDTTENLGKSYTVQIGVSADTSKDWSKYAIGHDQNNGKLFVISPDAIKEIQGKKYFPGVLHTNKPAGIIRVCPYQTISFARIFGNI